LGSERLSIFSHGCNEINNWRRFIAIINFSLSLCVCVSFLSRSFKKAKTLFIDWHTITHTLLLMYVDDG
jgi:hypothetical protein